jgi:hypothetical protein
VLRSGAGEKQYQIYQRKMGLFYFNTFFANSQLTNVTKVIILALSTIPMLRTANSRNSAGLEQNELSWFPKELKPAPRSPWTTRIITRMA